VTSVKHLADSVVATVRTYVDGPSPRRTSASTPSKRASTHRRSTSTTTTKCKAFHEADDAQRYYHKRCDKVETELQAAVRRIDQLEDILGVDARSP